MHFYSRNIHGCQLHRTVILWRYLRPKLLVASEFHSFLALGTSAFIPYPDAVATTIQTQTSHLTPIRRSHIGDDPTNHKILNRLAIWARHSRNFLSEEPSPFIHLGFIAASPTAIFQLPSHLTLKSLSVVLNDRTAVSRCRHADAYRYPDSSGNSCIRHNRPSSSTHGCDTFGNGSPTRP